MSVQQHKYLLDESDMPTSWYNIIPDLPSQDKVIVTALCGHGLLDVASYDAYLGGRMVDSGLSDQDLASALAAVPVLTG